MKRNTFVMFAVAMFLFATTAMAQNTAPDFSGNWTLDIGKSKMQMPVESMTMTVAQTATELTVTTATKRPAPPEGAGGRGGRGGMMGGGDGTFAYSLDGKEKTIQADGPMGPMPVALKAKAEDSKLKLSQTRTFNSPMGEVSMTTKETWSIDASGVLTVSRESTTPRGTNSSTMVFTKKQ